MFVLMASQSEGNPMSPSDQWLFDTLNSMRQESQDRHQRLRADVNAGFDKIWEELKGLRKDQTATDKDVTVIKTERGMEAKSAAAKAGWVAFLAGTAVSLVLKWFDVFGKK